MDLEIGKTLFLPAGSNYRRMRPLSIYICKITRVQSIEGGIVTIKMSVGAAGESPPIGQDGSRGKFLC